MNDEHRPVSSLLLLALATPLVWAPGFVFPYVVPKAFFFQTIVALALLATALARIGRGHGTASDGAGSPGRRGDPVLWALAALVAVGALSAVVGDAPSRSLLGTFERRWGVLAWILFLAFYGLLRTRLDDRAWRWALRATALVATLVVAVGLVGHHGLQGADAAPWQRLSSTLGNPGYMAAYLALTMSATGYLAWSASDGAPRLLWGLAAVAQAYALLLTGTRAIFLGIGVGLLFVAATGFLVSTDRHVRGAAAGLAGLVSLAALALWLAPVHDLVAGWAERLTALTPEATNMQKRFSVWEAAVTALREDPLLGTGLENFHLVWSRHFDPVVYNLNPVKVGFDRAHNVLMEAGATMGAPGIVAWLGLWAAVYYSLLRAWRRETLSGPGAAIFGFGFTTYLVYLLFWFEDYGSFIAFLALVGFVAHRAYAPAGASGEGKAGFWPPIRGIGASPPVSSAVQVGAVAGLLLLVGITTWHNVRVLEAARETWQGELAMDAWEGATDFQTALEPGLPGNGPIVRVYLRRLAFLSRFGDRGSPEGPSPRMKRALAAGERAIEAWRARDPENPYVYVQRSRLCGIRSDVHGDASGESCVGESLRRAIDLAPGRIRYRHLLAQHHLAAGRPGLAVEVLQDALEVYDSFGGTYHQLALVHQRTGDMSEAVRQARVAITLGYGAQPATFLLELADWLASQGRPGDAADLLEADLALSYRDLARPESAKPSGRGFGPWDLHLASRLPLFHWRAGRPREAVRTARFLAHRMAATGEGDGADRVGASVGAFIDDVRADRLERWTGVERVLDGPSREAMTDR